MSIDAAGQVPAELPGDREGVLDGLLDALPQEAAAGVTLVQKIGSTVFLACREFPHEAVNPLRDLTPREYEILLLAANALSYKAIAREAKISPTTVRTHLYHAYSTLGVPDKEQASSFIPMAEQRLRGEPAIRAVLGEDDNGRAGSLLGAKEAEVFRLVTDGYTTREIAQIQNRDPSTIRSQRLSLARKLGIDTDVDSEGVELRRVAGAMQSLEREMTATLQPRITDIVTSLEGKGPELIDGQMIAPAVSDRTLSAKLVQGAYMTPAMAEHGSIDLAGLVAAQLINQAENQALMADELRQPIIRKVIRQAVEDYSMEHEAQGQAADR